ncbi:MAG TPA: peptidase S8 and S53 subtilisin kexin sedolisin [Candidatus Binatia bacterium]|nr:peptidase S8 and S53 subtilisin kexin sedolisin [Candidatus Binatia bacterium]
MRSPLASLPIAAVALLFGFTMSAQAQNAQRHGKVIVPDSSVEHTGDAGHRAHTNHLIFVPDRKTQSSLSRPSGETPASLGCVYGLVSPLASGCTIAGSTVNPSRGAGAIAIVDAYDDPTAENDLAVFSSTFGLPQANFTQVFASGTKPRTNCGWAQEISLDIEWAHAMAPYAKIYLVEASSSSLSALMKAESVAASLVAGAGGGEVTNSWSSGEFSSETSYDSNFSHPGVVYFGSAGDKAGALGYPSVSPNVVSAGGTSVQRDSQGNFTGEVVWNNQYGGTGGGSSVYEPRPGYQDGIVGIVGSHRGTPDFSFDADPGTGVSVYDSTSCQGQSGWLVFGGTSVSSPALAGIVNAGGHLYASSDIELSTLYSNLGNGSDFRDITSGTCGSHAAGTGWDFCTGVGSNVGLAGK